MQRSYSQSGFSLIEMIVSLAVFSGVITIAVGALLVLVASNDQLQGEQSVMTNLSFALDSMTREIRTGTAYYCESRTNYSAGGPNNIFRGGNNLDGIVGTDTQDCHTGRSNPSWALHGLTFIEGGNSISGADNSRILYFHDSDAGQLFRRIGTEDPVPITSSGIFIHEAEFYVTGSEPQSGGSGSHYDQASVTIFIEASATSTAPTNERYQIQTSITQRTLDI